MADRLALSIAGEPMQLFADRALYWPARKRLLIADLHLGKGDVFRAAGIALPSGGTAHDLARLSRLIEASGAREVWVLGDLLHGATHHARWRDTWNQWRAEHTAIRFVALRGNHDRFRDAAALDIEALGDAESDAPYLLCHEPHAHPSLHVIAGHLHPVVKLPGLPRRMPAFWLREGMTVLPAFSAFTGGYAPPFADGGRYAVCAEDHIALV